MRDERELWDRIELRELVDRYASGVDRGDFDAVAAVFTEHGELAIYDPGAQRPSRVHQGREAIRRAMRALAQFEVTTHLVANQVLDVDGDRATGETYCVANHLYERDGARRDYTMALRYHDVFVRDGDRWLIAERENRVDWVTDRPCPRPG